MYAASVALLVLCRTAALAASIGRCCCTVHQTGEWLPLAPQGSLLVHAFLASHRQYPLCACVLSSPTLVCPSSLFSTSSLSLPPSQEALQSVADVSLAVNLSLREEVLVTKMLGRRECRECGRGFNLADIRLPASQCGARPAIVMPALLPPAPCSGKMTSREDDTEDVVQARLAAYKEQVRSGGEGGGGRGRTRHGWSVVGETSPPVR